MKKLLTIFILTVVGLKGHWAKVPTCNEIELMKSAIYNVVDEKPSRVPNAVRFGEKMFSSNYLSCLPIFG